MASVLPAYQEAVVAELRALDLARVDNIAKVLMEVHRAGGAWFTCGNGGSGASAAHIVTDFVKSLEFHPRAMCLSDNLPLVLATSNDIDYAEVFTVPLRAWLKPEDAVIAISGSGDSENALRAVRLANERGATTIGLCGSGGGKLAGLAQLSLVLGTKDMQVIEDVHMCVLHMLFRRLRELDEMER